MVRSGVAAGRVPVFFVAWTFVSVFVGAGRCSTDIAAVRVPVFFVAWPFVPTSVGAGGRSSDGLGGAGGCPPPLLN